MPASAAALPLTVLVLAWDEAMPAVRTLIEAAPGLAPASIGSLLVLVPPAPLPAPAPAAPVEAPGEPTAAAAPAPAEPAQPAVSTALAGTTEEPAAVPEAPPAALAAWETASAPAPAPQPAGRTAVRVTQLVYTKPSGISQFTSSGPAQFPAAPYLGATPPPAAAPATRPAVAVAAAPLASPPTAPSRPAPAAAASAAPLASSAQAAPLPAAPEAHAPETYTAEAALAPDLEADLLPEAMAAPETPPLAPVQPVGAAAFSTADQAVAIQPDVSDSLSLDAEALAEPATTAAPPSDEPDFFEAAEFFASAAPADEETVPAAAFLTDAVSEAEPPAVASPPLQPVAASYPAPDLNLQVIRYARFAVPAALAAGPFGAIYAPAWPTWLAALELRQRTGCPLVLHLPALAAGREPADTAAGWPAEIQRQALRQADVVLTETYALARRLRRELGLAGTTVRVVPAADGGAIARALHRARRREATH